MFIHHLLRLLIFFFSGISSILNAQSGIIQSGPMLGPATLREVSIWIQTKEVADIQIEYKVKAEKTQYNKTSILKTKGEDGYAATLQLTNLSPGTTYDYKIKVNGSYWTTSYPFEFKTQEHWQYRKPIPDFSFVAGSCFYINDSMYDRPGKSYGGGYEIIKSIKETNPDFMVWLGDNIYLREGDFDSRSGIYYRNTHTRSLPELQPLLAALPHYAIWDDHDYGTNDSDWTYVLKGHALDAFKDFWPSQSYGAGHTEGVTNSFIWNDCQFFMLDNRWYRTVQKEEGTILGDQQKYWFKEALLASKATYKFVAVGSQFLNDFVGFENFSNYKSEREELIQFIDDNNIKNVVFLTGDRHHSEVSKLTTDKGNVIFDVTSSAMTSSTYDHLSEANTLRIKGSHIAERNFAVFNISGTEKERKLSVVFKNTRGEQIYKYSFE